MRLSYGKTGLGPNKIGVLRYLLPFNGLFHIGAKAHDIGYRRGGNEMDRERVDNLFLLLCVSASRDRIVPALFAYAYFIAVRIFGKYFFNYGGCQFKS